MAFPRRMGRQVVIFQSTRHGAKVRQRRLHVFRSLAEAATALGSPEAWALFCDRLELQLGSAAALDREAFRLALGKVLAETPAADRMTDLELAVDRLASLLADFRAPLMEFRLNVLRTARESLVGLLTLINEKLSLLDKEDHIVKTRRPTVSAEDINPATCFDIGLDHYEKGEWRLARGQFMLGLRASPEHPGLLSHVGLIDLIDGDLDAALSCFDKAVECSRRAGTRVRMRAIQNKAVTLMRMKRYDEAIQLLEPPRIWRGRPGFRNLIGECYLNLGDMEQARTWYCEILWPEAHYVRALIRMLTGDRRAAMAHAVTGVFWNPHMGRMLLGLEKRHAVRYVGQGLPADAEASEFMYQSGDLFNRHWEFRVLLRCVLDDPCVQDTLTGLEDVRRRQKHDREYRVPSELDDLLTGSPGKKDLEERVARLYARLVDPDGPYWFPAEGELLDVTVLRTGRQNWMVRCGGARIGSFYLRVDVSAPPHVTPGSVLRIRVTKRWYHRRRLYVVGTVEPAGE